MDFKKIDASHTMREKWHSRRLEVFAGEHFRLQLANDPTLAVSSGEAYDFAAKAGIQGYPVLEAQTFDNNVVVQ